MEAGAEELEDEAAERVRRGLEGVEQGASGGEADEEVAVAFEDRLVDDELHIERAEQHEDFEQHGEHEGLSQGFDHIWAEAYEVEQIERGAFAALREAGGGGEFEDDAGEGAVKRAQRDAALADGGIMDDGLAAADGDDEVLELPMQDAGQAEFGAILGVAAQRAGGQVERASGSDEVFEGGAFQRDREAAAQGGHVGIEAVMAGDHGETGEAAPGGFGLADMGEAAKPGRMEHTNFRFNIN